MGEEEGRAGGGALLSLYFSALRLQELQLLRRTTTYPPDRKFPSVCTKHPENSGQAGQILGRLVTAPGTFRRSTLMLEEGPKQTLQGSASNRFREQALPGYAERGFPWL